MTAESRIREAFASVGLPEPTGFAGLLGDALRLVVTERPLADPAHHLTDADLAELRAAGFATGRSGSYADAVGRTTAKMAAILADSMPVDEAAGLMGVTPARVRQMLGDRGLVGVRTSEGWRVPRFQFVGREPVRGLRTVASALPGTLHPVAFHAWFTSPSPVLVVQDRSVSPRDWLASGGDPGPVAAEAAAL